jgi:hypothetical protein
MPYTNKSARQSMDQEATHELAGSYDLLLIVACVVPEKEGDAVGVQADEGVGADGDDDRY